jgi:large subunit ribosomal protein L9
LKIILREDVRDLGHSGELVEVKPGYARNYLLPRKLAVPATPGNLKDYEKRIAVGREREARARASANAVAEQLRGKRYVIIQRAVEGGTRLHGSVTTADVAEVIKQKEGVELDRRDIDIRQPIRSLGEYQVNIKVMRGLTMPVRILVAESEPVEEPEAPAEAAQAEAPAPEAAATPAGAEAAAPEAEAAA